MSKNRIRRRHRRSRAKRGNWFTNMKLWQRILLIATVIVLCVFFSAVAYVYAKWSKIDTQDIKAEDIVINEEIKLNKELDLGEGYKTLLCSEWIPEPEAWEKETEQTVSLLPA